MANRRNEEEDTVVEEDEDKEAEWVEEGEEEDDAKIELAVRIWNPKHGCEANIIGNKTFFFQFHHWRDKQFVMEEQPWHFDHHVLIVDNVIGTIKPSEIPLFEVPFWVRVYDLPFKGRNNELNAKSIGEKVGSYMGIDKSDVIGITKSLRIRVKVDATKPLCSLVDLKMRNGEKTKVPIKYEKLPVFCYVCGRLGHGEKDCDEVRQGRRCSEKLRVTTPLRKSKIDGDAVEGEGRAVGRKLFVTKGRNTEEQSKFNEMTTLLQGVSLGESQQAGEHGGTMITNDQCSERAENAPNRGGEESATKKVACGGGEEQQVDGKVPKEGGLNLSFVMGSGEKGRRPWVQGVVVHLGERVTSSTRIRERLDRYMGSKLWCDRYAEWSVDHLMRYKSDHTPILLSCSQGGPKKRRRKEYKFETCWLLDERYDKLGRQIEVTESSLKRAQQKPISEESCAEW
ncbi:hypothetical protein RDABS01_029960 [Bienertia sinuspersici]